jgi:hypothetical protein
MIGPFPISTLRRHTGALVIAAALWISLSGQSPSLTLEEAQVAWDRGDYPTALTAYLTLLDSPDGDRLLESIALQTGELFQTIELTRDGGSPRFSPDGRHVLYEVGRGVNRRTRMVSTDAPGTVLADLPGHAAVFDADGSRLAYIALTPTAEMQKLEEAALAMTGADRAKAVLSLAALTETASRITLRDLASSAERVVDPGGRRKKAVALGADGTVLFTGSEDGSADQIYMLSSGRPVTRMTADEPDKVLQDVNATGTAALFTYRSSARGRGTGAPARFGVISVPDGVVSVLEGHSPAFSADGRTLAYVTGDPPSRLMVAPAAAPAKAVIVRTTAPVVDDPALSRDGSRLAFQARSAYDWELYVINRDGTAEQRITREIQHDVAPRFLTGDRLLGLIGEPRHRRSYLYDLTTGARTRLFHNNTIRTIAPEYAWAASPDGTKLLIVAERDGDTVSPERGVYLMDLSKKVRKSDLRTRLVANQAAEETLRARGRAMYAPIAEAVKRVVAEASATRIYGYEKALFDFDSKHISRPGNRLASAWLFDTYRSFGYQPELQWFEARGALGDQTANVIATLKGTVNPELVYVVSSHYDSEVDSPGADDDSSGTAALLETARILARHPQPATIVFASFTGEESGTLGSREFVRRALAGNVRIAGALNNDMIGWTNDHRLDDTIRYSNAGIRDVQHAAAIQFTSLITYDALYYKGTDAEEYYRAYGDIVGGIGSYPVLASPHYHQRHDVLETINHQLVTEVARTTAATLMLLASSPSRLQNLKVVSYQNGEATLSWSPSPEAGVTAYRVAWGPPDKPESQQIRVTKPAATIKAAPGSIVAVKAITNKGLEGWDWARTTIP